MYGPGLAIFDLIRIVIRGYSMLLLKGSEHILYGCTTRRPVVDAVLCGGSSTTNSVIDRPGANGRAGRAFSPTTFYPKK